MQTKVLHEQNTFFPLFLITALFFISLTLRSAEPPKKSPPQHRILFIFDASYSMTGEWEGEKKINIARKTLYHIVDSLDNKENILMGLRVYGHQSPVPPQDCDDTRLEVPFRENNARAIKQKLNFIDPKGTTPIARSLEKGGNDFPERCVNCRNIIILITDGKEECDGDACEISRQLQKKGIVLKPFIIGIGIDENFEESFDCMGEFYNTNSRRQFSKVMDVVINKALNSTTAQVNLLDSRGRPTETDVAMTFYDTYSGVMQKNYIHTINYRGQPDTIILDPLLDYNMKVHTLPPVKKEKIKITSGKHTIIPAETPMGSLIVKTKGSNKYKGVKFRVEKAGTNETICYQKLDRKQQYITGKYNLEIPVLPRLDVKNVEIEQDHTTTVTIPRPGIANIVMQSPGHGSLFQKKDGRLKWIYNLRTNVTKENLTLLPGNYFVVYRPKNVKKSIYSVTRSFKVKSGSAVTVQLY